jgi:ADP-dependent phosphofructokinase/glucokinase
VKLAGLQIESPFCFFSRVPLHTYQYLLLVLDRGEEEAKEEEINPILADVLRICGATRSTLWG